MVDPAPAPGLACGAQRALRPRMPGAMVTGGIVDYDAVSGLQFSPGAFGVPTRASSPNNVAVTAQWIAVRRCGRRCRRRVSPRPGCAAAALIPDSHPAWRKRADRPSSMAFESHPAAVARPHRPAWRRHRRARHRVRRGRAAAMAETFPLSRFTASMSRLRQRGQPARQASAAISATSRSSRAMPPSCGSRTPTT